MIQATVKQVKPGDFFRLKDDENSPLWVRSIYDRTSKRYCIYKYDDVNHFLSVKGDRKVYLS